MRAGLILAGAIMMAFGAILGITIFLLPMGALFGFIGLIMLIVGCATSGRPKQPQQVIVTYPPNYQQTPYQQPPTQYNPTQQPQKYCGNCGAPNPTQNRYCNRCGQTIQ